MRHGGQSFAIETCIGPIDDKPSFHEQSNRMNSLLNRNAPDFSLTDVHGERHRLDDHKGHWLLLVFHRQLGCMTCREHLRQLRQHQQELLDRKVAVAVITFDSDVLAKAYAKQTGLPWPLLIDRKHQTYRAYGMLRASWWSILRPSSIVKYLKLMLIKGHRIEKSGEDYRQLGGDVLINPQGIVRLHFVSDSPHDRPDVSEILTLSQESEDRPDNLPTTSEH